MKIQIRRATTAGVVLMSVSTVVPAQSRESVQVPRVRGESFVYAGHSTTGVTSLYGAARLGSGLVLAGLVVNRETNSYTAVVGAGTRVSLGGHAAARLIAAGARTREDVQARLYVMPRASVGAFRMNALGLLSQPVGSHASRKVSLNPLTLAVRVSPAFQVGASAILEQVEGRPLKSAAGPSVQIRLPRGVLSIEAYPWHHSMRPELHASVMAAR